MSTNFTFVVADLEKTLNSVTESLLEPLTRIYDLSSVGLSQKLENSLFVYYLPR